MSPSADRIGHHGRRSFGEGLQTPAAPPTVGPCDQSPSGMKKPKPYHGWGNAMSQAPILPTVSLWLGSTIAQSNSSG